ncbi:MAG: hypothetical protein M3Y09_00650 [Actinomycetota bacterium]|nr:hypothetical protein [Actinomycetota bacterium]
MRRALVMALGTIGFLVGSCGSAAAVTVPKARTKPFSEVEAGVTLSSTGLRFEDVYRVKRSPDGEGAAVRDGIYGGSTFPVSGTDTVTSNYKDGRQTASETFTLGIPRLDGVGTITGHGRCTGGTNQHQLEKCSYTLKGTYDLRTSVFNITLSGTDSRVTTGKPK